VAAYPVFVYVVSRVGRQADLLLLHLVGFLYYFTYIDDARQTQIKFKNIVELSITSLKGVNILYCYKRMSF